ncbi:MAG: recombination regulator RecX [Rhodoferax sp.]|jgi:regulatory protein|uniref:recombination regulator RecX n=1 Tax=Rhodoferax sp. TaxID=50421 RepID=UPI001B60C593|nr:recombination regulator RecX [Rhodoferax sp.]MBP9737794.1 recombination regulator RecX [Rhodoferax sp.]
MPTTPLSLRGRALRLLSGREYARLELERKLAPFEEAPGSLAGVLDDLQARGFISEQRVVESLLNRRAAKLGAARVKQELLALGVDAQHIDQAVAGLRETELARARKVWQKKFAAPAADAKARAQQARFMAARGFTGDTIRRVLSLSDDEVN